VTCPSCGHVYSVRVVPSNPQQAKRAAKERWSRTSAAERAAAMKQVTEARLQRQQEAAEPLTREDV
jgi:acyl-CoA reductase-like NAD-dependent aldehyde dehydrogenase